MNRVTEIVEESIVTRRVTRIHETEADVDPPDTCPVCDGPTLWNADTTARKCVDCGEEYEAITTPRLAIAGRRG